MHKCGVRILILCATISLLLSAAFAAAVVAENGHLHSHKIDNKERVSDGGFSSPKHYERGEHHTEFDHEAILGSRDTADEFDHLPPEEAKKRLTILAIAMDSNKNGRVEKDELVEWILNSFKMLNKEDADERHEESDSNSDGFVTWDEYTDENYGSTEFDDDSGLTGDSLQDKKVIKEDKELFLASDLDGDGKLSKSEFVPFTYPEEYDLTKQILLRRTMEERDLDGNGFLTLDEYLGPDAKYKDTEWHLTEKDKFDMEYDQNRDGMLSPEEVLSWIAPDDRESAEQEAEHLIENADENQDGVLTIKEIVDNHELFVGSEATDYGQHLHELHKFKEEL